MKSCILLPLPGLVISRRTYKIRHYFFSLLPETVLLMGHWNEEAHHSQATLLLFASYCLDIRGKVHFPNGWQTLPQEDDWGKWFLEPSKRHRTTSFQSSLLMWPAFLKGLVRILIAHDCWGCWQGLYSQLLFFGLCGEIISCSFGSERWPTEEGYFKSRWIFCPIQKVFPVADVHLPHCWVDLLVNTVTTMAYFNLHLSSQLHVFLLWKWSLKMANHTFFICYPTKFLWVRRLCKIVKGFLYANY